MAKNLVIVESPAKAKTIRKFLGNNYTVMASNGHVRDLPKSQLGVDIAHDFEPHYITIRGKGELLASLRQEVQKADRVYLATDPDREGEAISWHLKTALNLEDKDVKRVTFNEITKTAVKAAIKAPRTINQDLVDAQQARRILDRIVGYEISPILWAKVRRGLSAGRVQSAALKLLRDREDEINDFTEEEFWTIQGTFCKEKTPGEMVLQVVSHGGEKVVITSQEEAEKILRELEQVQFTVSEIKTGHRSRKAPDPFTTSTLQQEASRKLNFTPSKTMSIAQQLYEGVEIAGHGLTGLISYLRTDSTRISEEMKAAAKNYIATAYGVSYVKEGEAKARTTGRIQDAHEAIRPTYLTMDPKSIEGSLTRDQLRLYKLIFERFLASQMAPADYETQKITVKGGDYSQEAAFSKLSFPGFMKVYRPEDEQEETALPIKNLQEGDQLTLVQLEKLQHFTQPPARYTEGTLVRAMEENGVGRPSTYAPTIATLGVRGYVSKEKKALYVTELGYLIDDITAEYFSSIHDVSFTAQMEEELDRVETEGIDWKEILRSFYATFEPQVEKASKELEKVEVKEEPTDVICEKCGRNMVLRQGRYGQFYACPGFPECRNTKPYFETIQAPCPKCGGQVYIRRSRKGRVYYGCENNPTCDFMSWDRPSAKHCPKCGEILYEKRGKTTKLVCLNPDCRYQEVLDEE